MDLRKIILSQMSEDMRCTVALSIFCHIEIGPEILELLLAYDKGKITREEMITAISKDPRENE